MLTGICLNPPLVTLLQFCLRHIHLYALIFACLYPSTYALAEQSTQEVALFIQVTDGRAFTDNYLELEINEFKEKFPNIEVRVANINTSFDPLALFFDGYVSARVNRKLRHSLQETDRVKFLFINAHGGNKTDPRKMSGTTNLQGIGKFNSNGTVSGRFKRSLSHLKGRMAQNPVIALISCKTCTGHMDIDTARFEALANSLEVSDMDVVASYGSPSNRFQEGEVLNTKTKLVISIIPGAIIAGFLDLIFLYPIDFWADLTNIDFNHHTRTLSRVTAIFPSATIYVGLSLFSKRIGKFINELTYSIKHEVIWLHYEFRKNLDGLEVNYRRMHPGETFEQAFKRASCKSITN